MCAMREKKKDKMYEFLKAKVLAKEGDKMHRKSSLYRKWPIFGGAHGNRSQIWIKKQNLDAHGAW